MNAEDKKLWVKSIIEETRILSRLGQLKNLIEEADDAEDLPRALSYTCEFDTLEEKLSQLHKRYSARLIENPNNRMEIAALCKISNLQ